MSGGVRTAGLAEASWVGWCCSYCAASLAAHGHGLLCRAEGRWFATQDGVHRLLPEERRREQRLVVEMYQRVRGAEGWRAEPGLPEVAPSHPQARRWRVRAAGLRQARALAAARLGPGPWRVPDVGAGCCWAVIRLLEDGHRVAAVDVDTDEDGLRGAERVSVHAAALDRARRRWMPCPWSPRRLTSFSPPPRSITPLSRTLVELRA